MRDPRDGPERAMRHATMTAVWERETLTVVAADAHAAVRLQRTAAELIGADAGVVLEPDAGALRFVLNAAAREQSACVVWRTRTVADREVAAERITLTPLDAVAPPRWRIDVADVEPDAGMVGARNDAVIDLVSHELRSPLNAALTWASVLELDRSDATVERAVTIIKHSIHAQARLIDDLVDAARSGRSNVPLETIPNALTAVLDRAVAESRARHPGRTIRSTAPPLTVEADAPQLQRALRHLIDNAVKFSAPDAPVTLRGDLAGTRAVVDVADNGVGLSSADLAHVFHSFWRAEAKTSGGGLGLGVVRRVVERHGGMLAARSGGRDRGATFTFALPIAAA